MRENRVNPRIFELNLPGVTCNLKDSSSPRAGPRPGPGATADRRGHSCIEVWELVFLRQNQGQASLEYVLVLGAVVVALLGFWTLAPDMVNAVSGSLCSAVDPIGAGSCLVP